MKTDTATVAGSRPAEKELVIRWRVEELSRAGYSRIAAEALARRTEVDLHQAVSLPRNGCPQDVALRILL